MFSATPYDRASLDAANSAREHPHEVVRTLQVMKTHHFEATVIWVGNDGQGTADYRSYRRDHEITATGHAPILGSSDPSFRGDSTRYNPEELLVASLSQCHMLWYLHLCTTVGVVVTAYQDRASGEMAEAADGSGQFTSVTLRPHVTVASPDMTSEAVRLHGEVHKFCFIARSVNFPVVHEPQVFAEVERRSAT
jgi:organic hydroperoxide reductase OsmC/OhrA